MKSNEDFQLPDVRLPSPPAIAVRIIEAAKKDRASSDEMAKIVSSDPALAAKILRVANSPVYRLPYKVESISKALTVLGTNALRNIALSFVIAENLTIHKNGAFDFELFWKRSVTAGVAAEALSLLLRVNKEDSFVTALLKDIGMVILFLSNPDAYSKILDDHAVTHVPIVELEKEAFGCDHQEIGSRTLEQWGLPDSIYLPVRYHHRNGEVPLDIQLSSRLLFLSDILSSIYHGTRSAECFQELERLLLQEHGIVEMDAEQLIDGVGQKSIQIMSFFDIDPGKMKPFSQLLQEANEELSKLNLSYEQLVIELKQAKEKAENFADKLRKANDKLRDLAFRDGLTGLYNHAFLQNSMDREINRAYRYGRAFSFLMFDIDHFKRINDEHGHPVGDMYLKEIGTLTAKSVRLSDIAARYGGEEFAIILPETGLKQAAHLGERLRKGVESLVLADGGREVRSTISIGITSYEPGDEVLEKDAIIAAADKAMYHSKKSGRNKMTLMMLGNPSIKTCALS